MTNVISPICESWNGRYMYGSGISPTWLMGADSVSHLLDAGKDAQVGEHCVAHGSIGLLRKGDQNLIAREADGLGTGVDETAHQRTGRDQQSESNADLYPDGGASRDGNPGRS